MYYKRGKGAKVYRNSGFRNYGCLVGLLLLPFQILWIAARTVMQEISGRF